MGKRSRKRTGPKGPVARSGDGGAWRADPAAARGGTRAQRAARTAAAPAPVPAPDRRARKQEAPKAPWAPLPVSELLILLGMILVIVGFVRGASGAGPPLVAGFAFICLAGIELALREHRAGYRSHSTLLAGAAALIGIQPLIFAVGLPLWLALVLAVVIFVPVTLWARAVFKRKTGGLGFRA